MFPSCRPLTLKKVPEEIQNGDVLEIGKLPGIEKYSAALLTGFKPDVGLILVVYLVHSYPTFGAVNVVNLVKYFADVFTATVEDFLRHPLVQHFFYHVWFAKKTIANFTAPDSDFMSVRFFQHLTLALGALHESNLHGLVCFHPHTDCYR